MQYDRDLVFGSVNIGRDILTYSTWKKEVIIEEVTTGKIIYHTAVKDICYVKPIYKQGKLYFPYSNDKFVCMDVKSNKLIWEKQIKNRCTGLYDLNNNLLLDIKHHGFIRINPDDGKMEFEILFGFTNDCRMPDLSPYKISIDKEKFYLSNWNCNTVSAFDNTNGKIKWTADFGFGESDNLPVNDVLFVGINRTYKGGEIYLLNSVTGNVLFKVEALFEQNFHPVLYKNKVYYYTYDSKFHEFDISGRLDKVIHTFNEDDSFSGRQTYFLGHKLYYNIFAKVFALDLENHSLKVVGKTEKDIGGVADINGQIRFIY